MQPTNVFKNLRIAVHGDFGKNWPKSRFSRFIDNNGGKMVGVSAEGVTHLITTVKAYKQNEAPVAKAKQLGIYLVNFDWFADSTLHRRKKSESRFSIVKEAQAKTEEKEARKRERDAYVETQVAKFNKGVKEAESAFKMGGYEIYIDPTGFEYDILLTRKSLPNKNPERMNIMLFRSFDPPHAFACSAKYTSPAGSVSHIVEAGTQSTFEDAFEAFCKRFKERTLKKWQDRCDGKVVLLGSGKANPVAYTYTPPEHGPVGMYGPFTIDDEGYLAGIKREKNRLPLPTQVIQEIQEESQEPVEIGVDVHMEREAEAEAQTNVEMATDSNANAENVVPSIETSDEVGQTEIAKNSDCDKDEEGDDKDEDDEDDEDEEDEDEDEDEDGEDGEGDETSEEEGEDFVVTYNGKRKMRTGIVKGYWGGVVR